LKIKGLQKM